MILPFRSSLPTRSSPKLVVSLILAHLILGLFSVFASRVSVGGELARWVFGSFEHSGWLSLAGFVWYLWLVGPTLEDRIGSLRLAALYALAVGTATGVVELGFAGEYTALPPLILAALLGANLSLFSYGRVFTVVPFFRYFWYVVELPMLLYAAIWLVFATLGQLLVASLIAIACGAVLVRIVAPEPAAKYGPSWAQVVSS